MVVVTVEAKASHLVDQDARSVSKAKQGVVGEDLEMHRRAAAGCWSVTTVQSRAGGRAGGRACRQAGCALTTGYPIVRACMIASCAMVEKAWWACTRVMRSRRSTARSMGKPPKRVGRVADW